MIRDLLESLQGQTPEDTNEGWGAQALASIVLAGAFAFSSMPDVEAAPKPEISWTQAETKYQADSDIVAKVIAGEAASEGSAGMLAVACVIQNRGGDHTKAVLAKYQFEAIIYPSMMEKNYKDNKAEADRLAGQIGSLTDVTNGATNFLSRWYYDHVRAKESRKVSPGEEWIRSMSVVHETDKLVFLK